MNSNYPLIGMDIGGTNARAGLVENGQLTHLESIPIKSNGTVKEVLEQIFDLIDRVKTAAVNGIGIAFPSIMDVEKGIVFDVQNIPAWKEVHLKEIIEQRYGLPVRINNDANCFALGEKYFGQGQDYRHLVGLIVGTGLGAGIVIDGKIHSGANGGAGEFGMIPYRDKYLEYYCSGQFFDNHGNKSGNRLASAATTGDKDALAIFKVFGHHFGQAIKIIQYTIDPEIIILGGSVRKAFPFFKDSMWKALENFAFISSLKNIRIAISEDDYIAILGAAALHMSKG
ncbi:MAG: ROK family protein [Candidatus Marinimicrobia bacterium]|nr:ROK family protein [Candidatus Neomarinimicrobiota bacterium]